jgi:hypothetical protein
MTTNPVEMREFTDEKGRSWTAGIRERPGLDFKGRYSFEARPTGAGSEEAIELGDVRWNSEKTAFRTLKTMSEVELRRRLRSALGRAVFRRD